MNFILFNNEFYLNVINFKNQIFLKFQIYNILFGGHDFKLI